MPLSESLKISLRALRANPLRSLLTMLGIMIGVASVVTMVALGAGAQMQIREQIRSLGANVLMLQPGEARDGGVRQQGGSGHTLTERDAEAIGTLAMIEASAPTVWGTAQVVSGNRNWNTRVYGTTGDYFVVREWVLSSGRYFSSGEQENASKVVVLGQTVADQLFPDTSAIGETIRVLQVPFEIIGVLAKKGQSGSGRNQDDSIFVPLSTAKLRLIGSAHQVNKESVDYILFKVSSEDRIPAAEQELSRILRQRHRLRPDQPDDFRISDPAAAAAAQTASTRTIAWLLASIASVSLVVGGISIMNIMLVSVTERRREIGLRMAVGARKRDIRNQFLIEATTLCALGGFFGLLIGICVSIVIANLAGWPILISPAAMLIAVVFSGIIGIFFGYYPARRAASLDPITCLRAE